MLAAPDRQTTDVPKAHLHLPSHASLIIIANALRF